jgi:hypothetical protein
LFLLIGTSAENAKEFGAKMGKILMGDNTAHTQKE